MLATPHALVGALIATKVHNPAIGIPVAFFSHFLYDLVPHCDGGWQPNRTVSRILDPMMRKRIFLEAAIDTLAGFVLCYWFFGDQVDPIYLFAIIIAAQGPDWLTVPYWLFHYRSFPVNIIYKIQHKMQLHAAPPWGYINQAIAVAATAVIISRIP